jgi:hypothetical protein
VRDQVTRHNNSSGVFQDAYLNQHVCFDVQNAELGEPLQGRMLGMLTHVGRTCDPRASSDMVPDDVWEHLPADPAIVDLERRRDALKAASGYRVKGTPHEDEIRVLNKRIYAARARRRKMVERRYREYYFDNRPTWDLALQASGQAPVDFNSDTDKPPRELPLRERDELATLLCDDAPLESDEALDRLHVRVGAAMVRLRRLREGMREGMRPEIRGFLGALAAEDASQCPAQGATRPPKRRRTTPIPTLIDDPLPPPPPVSLHALVPLRVPLHVSVPVPVPTSHAQRFGSSPVDFGFVPARLRFASLGNTIHVSGGAGRGWSHLGVDPWHYRNVAGAKADCRMQAQTTHAVDRSADACSRFVTV